MPGVSKKTMGQSIVEYLLLLSIVGILAFLAMKEGGMVDQLQAKSLDYYGSGASAIKGGPKTP